MAGLCDGESAVRCFHVACLTLFFPVSLLPGR